jgi:hypothetical protein
MIIARLAVFVAVECALLGALAFWAASRTQMLLRVLGAILALLLFANALISLIDLALIGDALPGGMPTPPNVDPHRIQAVSEYGAAVLSLVVGWVVGTRRRKVLGRS